MRVLGIAALTIVGLLYVAFNLTMARMHHPDSWPAAIRLAVFVNAVVFGIVSMLVFGLVYGIPSS